MQNQQDFEVNKISGGFFFFSVNTLAFQSVVIGM